jgi:hypothetical protein
MTIEQDLAVCFANLKGPKEKDYLATARALQRLKSHPQYNSDSKLGQAVGVSREVVREFLAILKLPDEIQALFGPQGLKLEHGRRLWQLARRRPELQHRVADAMSDLGAHDARYLVEHVLNHPEMSVAEAKRQVLESKTEVRREYHVIAMLSEEDYKALDKAAHLRRQPVDRLVTWIVESWLEGQKAP